LLVREFGAFAGAGFLLPTCGADRALLLGALGVEFREAEEDFVADGIGPAVADALGDGLAAGLFLETVGDEFAGGGKVAPAVGGEDGAVHPRAQLTKAPTVRVAFVAGVEAVVGGW